MKIELPAELEPFETDLRFFFELMVRKLYINRHKGFAEGAEVPNLWSGLQEEMAELSVALGHLGQFESAMEAVDVANFAFLLASRCLELPKVNYIKERARLAVREAENEH